MGQICLTSCAVRAYFISWAAEICDVGDGDTPLEGGCPEVYSLRASWVVPERAEFGRESRSLAHAASLAIALPAPS